MHVEKVPCEVGPREQQDRDVVLLRCHVELDQHAVHGCELPIEAVERVDDREVLLRQAHVVTFGAGDQLGARPAAQAPAQRWRSAVAEG